MHLLGKTGFALFIVLSGIIMLMLNTGYGVSQDSEETKLSDRLSFYLHFKQPDLENQRINVLMQSFLSATEFNAPALNVQISNGYTANNIMLGFNEYQMISIAQKDNWTSNGITYFNYQKEDNFSLQFFGLAELYPFDSYLLNLTFTVSDYGMIDNNTDIAISARMLYEGQSGWYMEKDGPLIVEHLISPAQFTQLNQKLILRRVDWSISPLFTVLFVGFGILGAAVLIEPKELKTKSALFTSIFIFSGTFYFNISSNIPKTVSLSMGEYLVMSLFFGAGLLLVVGIIQYRISRVSDSYTFRFIQNCLLAIPIISLTYLVYTEFEAARSYSKMFYWTSIPSEAVFLWSFFFFWAYNFIEWYLMRKKTKSLEEKARNTV